MSDKKALVDEEECKHCVDGIVPMTMNRDCPHCRPVMVNSQPQGDASPQARPDDFTEKHGSDLRGIEVGKPLTQDQWDAVCAFVRDQDRIIEAYEEQASGEIPDAETFRLHMGELTTEEVQIAQAAYRLALSQRPVVKCMCWHQGDINYD